MPFRAGPGGFSACRTMSSWAVTCWQTRRIIRICCSLQHSIWSLCASTAMQVGLEAIGRAEHSASPPCWSSPGPRGRSYASETDESAPALHRLAARYMITDPDKNNGQRGHSRQRPKFRVMHCHHHLLAALERPGSPDEAATRLRVRRKRHGPAAAPRTACANFPHCEGSAPR